ncbi:MAG: hypothetical protein JWN44_3527 [Myxococcales bacterium]|nr:hypothetical protein [Myxococcales bacterium]
MADTWRQDAGPTEPIPTPRRSSKSLTLSPLVERALYREIARRRDLRPHAQLGIAPGAVSAAIESAFARLRNEYDPQAFEAYGEHAVAAATEICELLRGAYDAMHARGESADCAEPPLRALQPREASDETLRARETLRVAIERRRADADSHRNAGRTREAIRAYESVLLLDRTDETARTQLEQLRGAGEPTRARSWLAIFRRKSR